MSPTSKLHAIFINSAFIWTKNMFHQMWWLVISVSYRDVNGEPDIRFLVWKPKSGFRFLKPVFEFIFYNQFSCQKFHNVGKIFLSSGIRAGATPNKRIGHAWQKAVVPLLSKTSVGWRQPVYCLSLLCETAVGLFS